MLHYVCQFSFLPIRIVSFKYISKDGSELKYSAAQVHVKCPPSLKKTQLQWSLLVLSAFKIHVLSAFKIHTTACTERIFNITMS